MIAVVHSATLVGVDAHPVRVEVDVANGLPSFQIVGLPDASVRESRDRVRSAIRNSGFEFPLRRVTVNLAPGDLRKYGAAFDLAIALGLLAAGGSVPVDYLAPLIVIGELSLDGRLRPARGVLPTAALARRLGGRVLLLPSPNLAETCVVAEAKALGVGSLREAVGVLAADPRQTARVRPCETVRQAPEPTYPSLDEVGGQALAKRALEIAAAGGHHVLLIGPPGAGKTMLARRLPGLLPAWSFEAALEATSIHSAAGLLPAGAGLLSMRPFRAPHHTASAVSIVGGGRPPRPGEVSLAHRGVLFLDELPEFTTTAIESLRQPLEDRRVVITRAGHSVIFPAHFQLVAAMNPCPCGEGDASNGSCRCTNAQRARYQSRLSGPFLDRLDLVVGVQRPSTADLWAPPSSSAARIRHRVEAAQELRRCRSGAVGMRPNADLEGQMVWEACISTPAVRGVFDRAAERLRLSARALVRLARVARTIADLEGNETVSESHVLEALHYRPDIARKDGGRGGGSAPPVR